MSFWAAMILIGLLQMYAAANLIRASHYQKATAEYNRGILNGRWGQWHKRQDARPAWQRRILR